MEKLMNVENKWRNFIEHVQVEGPISNIVLE